MHAFGQALTCNSVSRGDIRVPPGTLLQLPSPFGEPLLLTCELSQPIGGRRASIGRLAKQRRQLPLRICQLPSLELEGGPAPESSLPDEAELASFVAGFYAAHAGLPPPRPGMHELRALQLRMLRSSLAWASRALGLPKPDGDAAG